MLKAIKQTRAPARSEAQILAERVLRFLDQQMLEPTPAHYALVYAALGPTNAVLSRAVDAITLGGHRITDRQAQDMSVRFLKSGSESRAASPANDALRHQTLRIADLAADAVAATGNFNRDLSAELGAFPQDGARVVERIEAMVLRSERAERELSAAAREVEALRQQLDDARSDADHDALTGIANRRGAEKRISELSLPAIVALCDVDRFKTVNDEFGHAVGDRVLKLVADTLATTCAPHFVARWGGEEFLVLLEGVTIEGAAALIDRARQQMWERRIRLRQTDQPLRSVTFSAGVAAFAPRSFQAALREADERLYAAKAAGRNKVFATA